MDALRITDNLMRMVVRRTDFLVHNLVTFLPLLRKKLEVKYLSISATEHNGRLC